MKTKDSEIQLVFVNNLKFATLWYFDFDIFSGNIIKLCNYILLNAF